LKRNPQRNLRIFCVQNTFMEVKNTMNKFMTKVTLKALQAKRLLASKRVDIFVDSGIKILIAVVIGALLLGGLYALFGDTILPTLTEKVEEMFEFAG